MQRERLKKGNKSEDSGGNTCIIVEQIAHVTNSVLEVVRSGIAAEETEDLLAESSVTGPDDKADDG